MIDSHLHLQDPVLLEKIDVILPEIRSAGVARLVVNGTRPDDWKAVGDLASTNQEVIAFYGLHPWYVNGCRDRWEDLLRGRLESDVTAGVGEIGLDKWMRNHDMARQKMAFASQLKMAQEFQRPAVIHCLKAWGALKDCLDNSPFTGRFLLHSYSGPAEMIEYFVLRGAWFSISGYFFREDKAAKLAVFDSVPENRILLETDAPDMHPPENLIATPLSRPDTGKPANHPANLSGVYKAYSEWAGISRQETRDRMKRNFASWYSGRDNQEST